MEAVPVEVIGNILSRVASARDVVTASTVCKKWRDAAHRHLRSLRFSTADWAAYGSGELSTKEIEVLITQTIMQTSCLRHLTICIAHGHKFSAAAVIAWLLHTRDTLQSLNYMIFSDPLVNILDRCGKNRLESLVLGHISISNIDVSIHRFPVLASLTLKRVLITSLDLHLILTACPKLENFSLVNSDPTLAEGNLSLELASSSLKAIAFEDLNLDNVHVIVEADHLESLYVKYSTFDHLQLVSKRSLKSLKMAHSNIFQLDIGDNTDDLEVMDISGFTLTWTKLFPMLLRSRKLTSLRLWSSPEVDENMMDMENVAKCFPKLKRLALSYDLADGVEHILKGFVVMEQVSVLEVGSDVINEVYVRWITALLERCPNLRRLVVHGRLSEASMEEDYQKISSFFTSIVNLSRMYVLVHVQFELS